MESELRVRLRGCRLVLEVGLDDETVTSTAAAVHMIVGAEDYPSQSLATRYPAILATYLVAVGVYRYDGDFWTHLPDPELDQAVLKQGFLTALRQLDLETFEDLDEREGWHRFVGPILAHGGIPRHSLGDFFRVLLRDLRRYGSGSAEELVALWRTRDTAFENVDRPVRRFFLYGGGPAVDFLDRCISLAHLTRDEATARGALDLGLPEHVLEAYFAAIRTSQGLPTRSGAIAVPRPRIRLDPWDRVGPVAQLPVTPAHLGGSRWLVNAGDKTREIEGSPFDETIIPLSPAPVWEIEFESAAVERTFAFECLGTSPVVCFDPSGGAYLDEARPLVVESLWLLAPSGAQIQAVDGAGSPRPAEIIAELPAPMGAWRGFDLLHVSLRDAVHLRVTTESAAGPSLSIVRVGRSLDRPSIIDAPLSAVASAEGYPVFARLPRIRLAVLAGVDPDRWTISVTTSTARRAGSGAGLMFEPGVLDIGPLVPELGPTRVALYLRGPLGSDLRTTFVVVPGLRLDRPTAVVLPDSERSLHVRATAGDPVTINGTPGPEGVDIPVPVGSSVAQVDVSGGAERIGLRVGVPKLTWAVMHTNAIGSLSTEAVAIDRDDLENGEAQAILISTGVADTPVQVSVEADRRPLAQSIWERTGGTEGRWAADLAQFRDAIRLSTESRLEVALAIPAGRCLAGYVVSRVIASDIAAEFDDASNTLEVEFVQARRVSHRVVRLWSRQRPWQPALEVPIPDESVKVAAVVEGFVPGDYRVQIAVDDPWSSAARPRRGADGTDDLTIGSIEAVMRAHKGLEFGSPIELLELAVVTGRVPAEIDDTDLPALAPQALLAAAELLDERDAHDDGRALTVVTRMLFTDAGLAIQAVTGALRAEVVEPNVVLALSVPALPAFGLVRGVGDRDLRQMWQAAPPVAAFADIPAAIEGDTEALDRCGQFMGWRPGEDLPPPRPGLQRVFLGMPAAQLRAIRDIVGLVPHQTIAYDTYALANFEWLLAMTAQRGPLDSWWQRYAWLATDTLGVGMPNEYLAARKAEPHPDFPWRDLPQAVLAAAFHVAARTQSAPEAVEALQAALGFASRLVQHDLVLARVLIARPNDEPVELDRDEDLGMVEGVE